jgi:hypothetical protein
MRSKAESIQHGRYTIRAMSVGNGWKAAAYLTAAMTKGGSWVAEEDGTSFDSVVQKIRVSLDARERSLHEARTPGPYFAVPNEQEYMEGLSYARFTPAQVEMLKAHAKAGDDGLTAGQIGRAGGYADFSSANLHYGKAGRLLSEVLHLTIPISPGREEPMPTGILAWWDAPEEGANGRWIMYPQLRRAVLAML